VAADPERLARFRREAQVLASLNHPNVAGIYGLDEADGKPFLVLELVEGEDLRQRLARGPFPVDEALDLAIQMASGLEAAHEKGIVHRDLKPANVKLTEDGKVKILDFGLAKALGSGVESGQGLASADTPTRTEQATTAGTILGTAAYMSPEQARGEGGGPPHRHLGLRRRPLRDAHGEAALRGETASDTLVAVLTREPDLGALPSAVPARVRTLLARCLRKDPRERLRDIGDARLELQEKESPSTSAPIPPFPQPRRRLRLGRWLVLTAVLGLVGGLVLGGWAMRRLMTREPPTFRQLSFGRGYVHSARFAPDGHTVLYGAAFEGGPLTLYSTRTDGFESRSLDVGEADVTGISRDGQMALLLGRHHVGAWPRVGTLAVVSLSGGMPRPILNDVYDADISPDGRQFAVVLQEGDQQVLQYPVGKEVFRTEGWIGVPRISPDGKRIAFVNHRVWGDDLGDVKVTQDDGKVSTILPEHQFLMGVVWARDGEHVWYSAAEDPGGGLLGEASLDGRVRHVLRTPALLRLEDMAADGRLLTMTDEMRVLIAGRLAGDTGERAVFSSPNDAIAAIADDGASYAGSNGDIVVQGEYGIYAREVGKPPVQLGLGATIGMTPDGRSVFATGLTSRQSVLTMYPVGAGKSREFDLADVVIQTSGGRVLTCSADGKRVAFIGLRPGEGRTAYVMDLEAAAPRPLPASDQGAFSAVLSPDGTSLAVGDLRRGLYVATVQGKSARRCPVPPPTICPWPGPPRAMACSSGTAPFPRTSTAST
jgi:Tol biopolymer transport system component